MFLSTMSYWLILYNLSIVEYNSFDMEKMSRDNLEFFNENEGPG